MNGGLFAGTVQTEAEKRGAPRDAGRCGKCSGLVYTGGDLCAKRSGSDVDRATALMQPLCVSPLRTILPRRVGPRTVSPTAKAGIAPADTSISVTDGEWRSVTTGASWIYVYSAAAGIACLLALMTTHMTWRQRHVPGAYFLGVTMLGAAVWSACALGELHSVSPAHTMLWAQLTYLGIVVTGPSWLLFTLSYTGRMPSRRYLQVLIIGLLAVIPILTVLFVFGAPSYPHVWSLIHLSASHYGHPLLVEYGPWFTVWLAFSYSTLLTGAGLLLHLVLRHATVLLRQATTLIVAMLIPATANVVYVLAGDALGGLDITPPAIAACGALTLWGISRHDVLRVSPALVPMAKAAILRDMQDAILILDPRRRVLGANASAEKLLGRSEKALFGMSVADVLEGATQLGELGGHTELDRTPVETTITDALGSQRWLEIVASPLGDPRYPTGRVLVMRDITQRKQLEQQLRYRGLHDELTGLLNRSAIQERIAALLHASESAYPAQPLSVLVLGLERFRVINGTLGHHTGDTLLRQFARRLTTKVKDAEWVARLDGDRFVVVLPGLDEAAALSAATRLRRQLAAAFRIQGQRVSLSASIGLATFPEHGSEAGLLLRHAGVACFAARESAHGVEVYRADADPNSRERLALLADLRTALRRGSLQLHYQPEIDPVSGRLVRVEALARWMRGDGVMVPPSEFITLAEHNGLLSSITTWVLDTAIETFCAKGGLNSDVGVAVNLSPTSLRDPSLASQVERALQRANASPDSLWLEITETSIMSDPERARRVLHEIRELGVRLAIDDFGTGHSSLAYLSELPISDVKIDGSFVRRMDTRREFGAIVRAIISLAHDLGLTVTAEGVETPSALDRLRELGCDHAQGYYIAHPMPADDLSRWAQQRQVAADYPGTENERPSQRPFSAHRGAY